MNCVRHADTGNAGLTKSLFLGNEGGRWGSRGLGTDDKEDKEEKQVGGGMLT